ncbi:acyltransferase family protein [Xylanimonas ulmi]|uniref:Acyltransferase-like protein n=1 Tax=Xylanimonas ulmi TaxID=228973 RepID=A0A4Q7M1Y1_9MICO|nr:acyltransferase [Xylanibacterium ulmi]RZS60817.1 acyltransferase-like protein [Xylanibacterium ulmi]
MPTIAELARRTPATRRRHVDLLRALAMGAVVVGHWLVMTVERGADGLLTGFTALPHLTVLHPLTWVFQVMPLFFLVGGVSNAISWTRARDRGRDAAGWLLDRSTRLFPPVTALLVTTAVGAVVAGWAGAPAVFVARVVELVVLPLWFLVVYLALIALTPAMHRLHERWGLAVPAVLLVGVVLGDVVRLSTGVELGAAGNFAFAWLAVHQLGFAWRDGSLRLTRARAAVLLAGAVTALVLLTGPGPYPVSMVSVPGAAIQNPSPPSLALMALAAAQVALAVLVAGPADRWLARRRPWAAVLGMNATVLTVYLWHMVASFVGAMLLDAVGMLPSSDVHSAAWWLGRVPWLATLSLVLAVFVAVFGRIETRTLTRKLAQGATAATPRGPLATLPVVLGAYGAAALGMYWLASAGRGPHGPFVVPTGALALVLGAAAMLRLARTARGRGVEADAVTAPTRPACAGRRGTSGPSRVISAARD